MNGAISSPNGVNGNGHGAGLPGPIAVIGLGYVGLPLALAFGRVTPTIGFDISARRVSELYSGHDRNGEHLAETLSPPHLTFTSDPEELAKAAFHIVAVPTPVDSARRPDTSYLVAASRLVGRALKARSEKRAGALAAAGRADTLRQGSGQAPVRPYTNDGGAEGKHERPAQPTSLDSGFHRNDEKGRDDGREAGGLAYVVFESTVYPGCTEEVCLPVLEAESGLVCGVDFYLGYSPERINPGDTEHTLETIVKIVAARLSPTAVRRGEGQTHRSAPTEGVAQEEPLDVIAGVYSLVAKAGVHRAPDIRTAEAAKVIENVQRDLNIALMNELSMLFNRMGINTRDVLAAARTKWNFLPFEPGMVGGHCIPVDPYYLTHKAQEIGYHPEVVLAGRRINDGMGAYVAHETVRLLIQAGRQVLGAKVLILGVTFKENVRDVRNSRVLDLAAELTRYGADVRVHDPLVPDEEIAELGLQPQADPFNSGPGWDGVVLAVPHRVLRERGAEAFRRLISPNGPGVLVDLRGVLQESLSGGDGILYWSL